MSVVCEHSWMSVSASPHSIAWRWPSAPIVHCEADTSFIMAHSTRRLRGHKENDLKAEHFVVSVTSSAVSMLLLHQECSKYGLAFVEGQGAKLGNVLEISSATQRCSMDGKVLHSLFGRASSIHCFVKLFRTWFLLASRDGFGHPLWLPPRLQSRDGGEKRLGHVRAHACSGWSLGLTSKETASKPNVRTEVNASPDWSRLVSITGRRRLLVRVNCSVVQTVH